MAIKHYFLILAFLLICLNSLISQEIFAPPDSLLASQICDTIYLAWKAPQPSNHEISGYNVFLEDSLITLTTNTNFQIQKQGYGFVTFKVTTVYDAGESLPASVDVELVIYTPATNFIYDKDRCEFTWNSPAGNHPYGFISGNTTFQWCDNQNENGIGTGTAQEFEAAAVWSPQDLSVYSNGQLFLKSIDFYPTEPTATYTVKVWQGSYAEEPDEVIYYQPVTNFNIYQWNSITLSDSILINTNRYLWVGYELSAPNGYPAGVDDGPAVDGYGNMMNFGGWQTLLEINPDLDYNWNIRAGFQYIILQNVIKYDIYGYEACDLPGVHWVKLNEEPIYDTSFYYPCMHLLDYWAPDTCYIQVIYCGTSVSSDKVYCEMCWFSGSGPADIRNESDFTVTSSQGYWNIYSKDALDKVQIYDLTGKIIYANRGKSIELVIYNQSFLPGLYIIEGITEKENFVRKIYKLQ